MGLKSIADINKKAYKNLANCWCETVCVLLLYIGFYSLFILLWLLLVGSFFGFDFIANGTILEIIKDHKIWFIVTAILISSASFIIKSPFNFGVSWYLLQISKGNTVQASCFFSCYTTPKRFFDTIKIRMILLARKMLFSIPIAAIAGLIYFLNKSISKTEHEQFWFTLLVVASVLVLCCLLVIFWFSNLKYSLVSYIYALNPDKKPKDIVKEGTKVIYGRQPFLTGVYVSFIKWLIPCFLIFPVIFVLPYLTLCFSCAAEEIISDYYSPDEDSYEIDDKSKEIDLLTSII